jgi:hypothetical protein
MFSPSHTVPRSALEYATVAGGDGLVEHGLALLVSETAATLHQLDHRIRLNEVKFPGREVFRYFSRNWHRNPL